MEYKKRNKPIMDIIYDYAEPRFMIGGAPDINGFRIRLKKSQESLPKMEEFLDRYNREYWYTKKAGNVTYLYIPFTDEEIQESDDWLEKEMQTHLNRMKAPKRESWDLESLKDVLNVKELLDTNKSKGEELKKKLQESIYTGKSVTGNELTYELKGNNLIIKDGDVVIVKTEVENPEEVEKHLLNSKGVKLLKEDTTQVVSIEGIQTKQTDNGISQMLIDAINGEWDTIKLYNDIIINLETYGYSDIANVIRDVSNEESKHVGQLQAALDTISSNVEDISKGTEEAISQLEGE